VWAQASAYGWYVYASIIWIIGILLSVFAVYLSWMCSTSQGQDIVMKVVLAIIAALFSLIYIIVHFVLVFATRNIDGVSAWCSPSRSGTSRRLGRGKQ